MLNTSCPKYGPLNHGRARNLSLAAGRISFHPSSFGTMLLMSNFYEKALFVKADLATALWWMQRLSLCPSRYASIFAFLGPDAKRGGAGWAYPSLSARPEAIAVTQMRRLRRGAERERLALVAQDDLRSAGAGTSVPTLCRLADSPAAIARHGGIARAGCRSPFLGGSRVGPLGLPDRGFGDVWSARTLG